MRDRSRSADISDYDRYDEPDPGLGGRLVALALRRPGDTFGLCLALVGAVAILVNATLLQDGRHPAPIFSGAAEPTVARRAPPPQPGMPALVASRVAAVPALPMPEPMPMAAPQPASAPLKEIQAELARRGLYEGAPDGLNGPKTVAAIRAFQTVAGLRVTGEPSPALLAALRSHGAARPAASDASPRVLAVQRVLADQGFGPLKVDGVAGEATRAAIRRFETSRGLPPRGEITPGILRELTAVSGVRLE